MGVYFLLIEDQLEVRPTHGIIVYGDGTRHHVENTSELRASVPDLAGQIRAARRTVREPIPVNPKFERGPMGISIVGNDLCQK